MNLQAKKVGKAASDIAHLLAETATDQTWRATYSGSYHSIFYTTECAAQLAEANGLNAFAAMLRRADHIKKYQGT